MKRSFIVTTLLTAVILTASAFLMAQQPGPKGKSKELRQEMRSYAEKNIIPVMKPQREKLDAVLSSAEKQEIASIREEMKAHHEKMRDQHKEMRQLHKEDATPSDEQRDAMRSLQKEGRLLMDRAWALADAHENTIYSLLDETETQQQQWREDIREIMEKYRGEMNPEGEEIKGKEGRKGHYPGGKGPHGLEGGPMGGRRGMMGGAEFLKPVGFLLWDGTLPEPRNFDKEQRGQGPDFDMQVFPNPTEGGANSLRFTVKKPGKVTVVLMDEAGTQVRTLLSEEKEAGTFTQKFDLGNLTPGVYYYQVQTPDERQVKRILIE